MALEGEVKMIYIYIIYHISKTLNIYFYENVVPNKGRISITEFWTKYYIIVFIIYNTNKMVTFSKMHSIMEIRPMLDQPHNFIYQLYKKKCKKWNGLFIKFEFRK